jgi:hypothetical protein
LRYWEVLFHAWINSNSKSLDSSQRFDTTKIPSGFGAKENPGNGCENQSVNGKFTKCTESAQDYMEGHPCQGEPARPILASKHKYSGENRQELSERYPDAIRLPYLAKVMYQANAAYCQIYAGENHDRDGAFVRIHDTASLRKFRK